MKKEISLLVMLCVTTFTFLSFNTSHQATITHYKQSNVITIEGAGITRTIETNGKETIKIEGANNKVTINGNCTKIDVEGTDNLITVNLVNTINVEGANNTVLYKGTLTKNKEVSSRTEGLNNTVKKVK